MVSYVWLNKVVLSLSYRYSVNNNKLGVFFLFFFFLIRFGKTYAYYLMYNSIPVWAGISVRSSSTYSFIFLYGRPTDVRIRFVPTFRTFTRWWWWKQHRNEKKRIRLTSIRACSVGTLAALGISAICTVIRCRLNWCVLCGVPCEKIGVQNVCRNNNKWKKIYIYKIAEEANEVRWLCATRFIRWILPWNAEPSGASDDGHNTIMACHSISIYIIIFKMWWMRMRCRCVTVSADGCFSSTQAMYLICQ